MPKKREKNDKEYYQGIIRELKAELKRLKQQVKRLERREHHHENLPEEKDDVQYENFEEVCPDCYKGKLVEHIVAGRYWVSCDCCNYRTKATKI